MFWMILLDEDDDDKDAQQDFNVHLSASMEVLTEGDAFNLTCETPPEENFLQQWLHPLEQASLTFSFLFCLPQCKQNMLISELKTNWYCVKGCKHTQCHRGVFWAPCRLHNSWSNAKTSFPSKESSKERSDTNLLCTLTCELHVFWVYKTDGCFSPLRVLLCDLVDAHVCGKWTTVCERAWRRVVSIIFFAWKAFGQSLSKLSFMVHSSHVRFLGFMSYLMLFLLLSPSLSIQARDAVSMKFVFPDKVQYILNIPKASVADSGLYECAVTNQFTGQTKSVNLGITVHGMCLTASTFTLTHLCFNH